MTPDGESTLYEVVIVGAGPAGATAAKVLAAKERRVAVLERRAAGAAPSGDGWVSVHAASLLAELGLKTKTVAAKPFATVTFYDAELGRTARPSKRGALGYLIETGAFGEALMKAATDAGAELHRPCEVASVRLREEAVTLTTTDGRTVEGRILIAAAGPHSPLTERLLPAARSHPGGRWTARVVSPLDTGSISLTPLSVVLGLDRQGGFGLVLVGESRVAVSVSSSDSGDAVPQLLAGLCRKLAEQQLLPVDLSSAAACARVRHTPAGVALDMDTHVGKHTVVVGEAGGFIAAGSDEGIYPAMWSARIAAEVVDRALSSRHSQDVLMEFDTQWRMAMAEYLRPPNTDTQFLIPLIFTNQPMANRMAAAFFNGENI